MNRVKLVNTVSIVGMIGISLMVFRYDPSPLNSGSAKDLTERPTMVPGAEAVRPLAFQQKNKPPALHPPKKENNTDPKTDVSQP